jgi:hypothetical protein
LFSGSDDPKIVFLAEKRDFNQQERPQNSPFFVFDARKSLSDKGLTR